MGLTVKKSKSTPKTKTSIKAKPQQAAKSKGKSKAVPAPMPSRDMEWEAEDDARTLMRAEEIKRDAARLRKAKAVAKKQADDASKVAGL